MLCMNECKKPLFSFFIIQKKSMNHRVFHGKKNYLVQQVYPKIWTENKEEEEEKEKTRTSINIIQVRKKKHIKSPSPSP